MQMNQTFNGWSNIGTSKLDTVMDYILTGRKAAEAKPDMWIVSQLGSPNDTRTILDFGCGVGRNTFGMASHSPTWTVTGYDNADMLSHCEEYYKLHYSPPIPPNVHFSSDWEVVKTQKFDNIVCCLVLQHIYEDALSQYIADFKNMTKNLMVAGRRINDDPNKGRSTWTILQENGLTPSVFLHGATRIPFQPEGEPEEHNVAIYTL